MNKYNDRSIEPTSPSSKILIRIRAENGLGIWGEELRAAGLEHLMAAVLKQRAFKWTGGVDQQSDRLNAHRNT